LSIYYYLLLLVYKQIKESLFWYQPYNERGIVPFRFH